MTKNFKISIRYKMSTAYGFHMDFQFWVHLTMLGGFQMLQSPRITKLDLEQLEMVQNQIFLFQRLDFEYTQLLLSPVLKNLKFWTFWTPLLAICNQYNTMSTYVISASIIRWVRIRLLTAAAKKHFNVVL